jgi:transcriptional regulator with XRE-family HTH domain
MKQAENFGAAVNRARLAKGLSLATLEALSGVSRGMLSKVERGEKQPTLPVACRIAQGLQISMSQLLGAETRPRAFVVTRANQRLTFTDPETGFVRELLSSAIESSGMEVVRHIIPPNQSSGDLPAYKAGFQKTVIVEGGQLSVHVGEWQHDLGTGDTLTFEPDLPHAFFNTGREACSYFLIIAFQPS